MGVFRCPTNPQDARTEYTRTNTYTTSRVGRLATFLLLSCFSPFFPPSFLPCQFPVSSRTRRFGRHDCRQAGSRSLFIREKVKPQRSRQQRCWFIATPHPILTMEGWKPKDRHPQHMRHPAATGPSQLVDHQRHYTHRHLGFFFLFCFFQLSAPPCDYITRMYTISSFVCHRRTAQQMDYLTLSTQTPSIYIQSSPIHE